MLEQFSVQTSQVKHSEVSSSIKGLSKEGGKAKNTLTGRPEIMMSAGRHIVRDKVMDEHSHFLLGL